MKRIDYSPDLTHFDSHRVPRTLWLVLAVVAWAYLARTLDGRYRHARAEFATGPDTKADLRRAEGESGHAQIDFGGQYVLGRMILAGEGQRLYHRDRLREVVRQVYPPEVGSPAQRAGREKSDEANMMFWFVGDDESPAPALGGPLYPPTHACLYSALALLPGPQAYHLFQVVSLVAALGAGLALARLTRWKLWLAWPLIATAILRFPHQQCGLDLGQNQSVTLLILSLGVLARARGYSPLAGLVWSLLAFKPTWAVAFLVVPIFLRDWRMLAGMVVGGATWVLLTLPVVGVQTWFDWLEVGKLAAAEYEVNTNWTALSRDLGGLFRRLLVDFTANPVEPSVMAGRLGMVAVLVVLAVTGWVSWFRARGAPGLLGFATLGAYLACFRFVYYDAVIAALPVILLATTPTRWRPRGVTVESEAGAWCGVASSVTLMLAAFLLYWEAVLKWETIGVTVAFGALAPPAPATPGMPAGAPTLSADTTVFTPSDTLILLVLWAWWAVKLGVRGRKTSSAHSARSSQSHFEL